MTAWDGEEVLVAVMVGVVDTEDVSGKRCRKVTRGGSVREQTR